VLRELQRELGRAFRETEAGGEAAARVVSALRPLERLSGAECIDLYRSAVSNALLGSLREIYPVCAALVGDDCFREIVRCYGPVRDASHPDLGRSGRALPAFLPELSFLDGVPYLADVARLELAWHEAFTASVPPSVIDPSKIADAVSHTPDEWRFALTPSATLIESEHPVLAIWEAHERAAEHGGEVMFERGESASYDRLIVWRRGSDLCIHRVDDSLWPLLLAIEARQSVAELLTLGDPLGDPHATELGEAAPEDYAPILSAIAELFERGWLVGAERTTDSIQSEPPSRLSEPPSIQSEPPSIQSEPHSIQSEQPSRKE
jgi:hypothetical protein